jgi:CDP-diglyceride synthetase
MRLRSISAIGVVFVGIVPSLMGGPVFVAVFTALCLIGLSEYNAMARLIGNDIAPTGYIAVVAFALVAASDGREEALLAACAFAVGAPLIIAIFRTDLDRAFVDWALGTSGSLYLGVPLFAAIALRDLGGTIDVNWLTKTADWLSFGWDSNPRGLAWLLLIIVVTWLSDTGAYLIGRALGRRPLIPKISPKKTVEGLIGGLACAALTGMIGAAVFGLGLPLLVAAAVGLVLSIVGVIGDLAESLLKRQAGVKDSGTLIPGHGGMLDRIDALLFTWTAGLFVATCVDRWV